MPNISDKIAEFAKNLSALEQVWEALKQEVDAKIGQMKSELEAAQAKIQAQPAESTHQPAKSQAKEQSGSFPYAVGEVVKVAFPELFKRKLINAGDLAYLLSKKASKDFKTRGYPVLRVYTTDDDPGLYACDHRRYYKMDPMVLGAKKYHLSSQFFPESRDAVLKWVYAHGLKKKELIEIIETKLSSNK